MKEETSGGHKDCAVPETGYCLIGGSSSKSIRGPPQSCRVWSVSRKSWKLGVFSPVMGKLRDISAVCVQISEWRAQKNMQPGSFQCCFTAEQEAVGSNSVKHKMFPVNRKHFFALRDQAPVEEWEEIAKWGLGFSILGDVQMLSGHLDIVLGNSLVHKMTFRDPSHQ